MQSLQFFIKNSCHLRHFISLFFPSIPLPSMSIGVETALSVLEAMKKGEVKATFGKFNFASANITQENNHVVLCLDHDNNTAPIDPFISKAALALSQQHKDIWIAKPSDVGSDYNDLLKNSGRNAVKASIEKAIPFDDYREPNRQPSTTFHTILLAAQKNNIQDIDIIKKSPEPCLNQRDNDMAKSISIPQPVKIEKIKEAEMEL